MATVPSAVADATRLRHAVTGQELGDFLPTAPENLKRAVRFNAAWWDANADRMAGVLRTVRVGPPLPTRP